MKYALQQLRHAANTLRKKAARRFLNWRNRNRPQAEVIAEERRLRGREQRGQAQGATQPKCSGWLGENAHVSQSRSAVTCSGPFGPGACRTCESG